MCFKRYIHLWAQRRIVRKAARVLQRGGLLLYPTDTLWGIGCDAANEQAVKKIFALKQRADSKSLIVIADSMAMVARYVPHIPEAAAALVASATQPLTVIYPQATGVAPSVAAADGSLAVRVVQHAFCRALLRRFGRPIISTSANLSGAPAPAAFCDIDGAILKGVDFVVPPAMEQNATRRPSSIVKLGDDGKIVALR
ncbi:MAG: threonylcarbamoyl-AMP synthase [Prevotellaceae bacterium]|jgi:L-threonylcarbamoyladenylate synthase|nr:threonylcarbamoyl-AMP synthase [Prevotellaceae bacterium]